MLHHRLRLIWILTFLTLLLTSRAHAQTGVIITTGPVTVNDSIEWTLVDPSLTTAAQAATMQVRMRLDGATGFTVLVAEGAGYTAGVSPVGWHASQRLTSSMVAALNARGAHQIRVSVLDPMTSIEGPSDVPFVLTSPPPAPAGTGLRRGAQP